MPFNFFNLSNLAFGNKLTVAFTQLERLVREASEHIGILIQDLRAYSKYLNRNYIIPEPVNNTDGCRVDELYSIIAEKVIVNDISYSNKELNLDCIIYNNNSGIITRLSGTTTLTSGYCYFNYASSNNSVGRTASFYTDENVLHGVKLFKFTVNTKNKTVKIDWSIR